MTAHSCMALISVVGAGLSVCLSASAAQNPTDAPAQVRPATGNLRRLQWEFDYQQRAYPLGFIPEDASARARQQIQQAKSRISRHGPVLGGGPQWVSIGPAPIVNGQITPPGPVSGRVTCIAVDPGNTARWLIGAAQGGIWETRNSGASWTPKSDDQASLAIGALAFAPSNPAVIYAGTGEGHFSDSYAGAGLLASSDGGSTWQLRAATLFSGKSFSSIIVNPARSEEHTSE